MRFHRIAGCGVALASLVITAGLSAPASAAPAPPDRERGAPGKWTQVSTGGSGTTYHSSLYRTADGVLHVVYPKGVGNADQLGHTAINPNGTIAAQNDILPAPWAIVDSTPRVIGDAGGGLRVVFGGQQASVIGDYWSDGRMYTLTAPASGASWVLPAEAVGLSHSAYGSYGTAATTLADGTPIAGFPFNPELTWHVGTGEATADQMFALEGCCAYNMSMVRDGDNVWAAWYANGSSATNNGTFVRQIYPTLGPIIKAPGSSIGADSLPSGPVALAARVGGGVYAAYCVGYPNCDHIGLWKVGASKASSVPSSRYAETIGLSAGPSGRLWVAWADNIPRVRAARTGRNGTGFTPVRTAGMPAGTDSVFDLAIEGTTGRGDIVVQVGNGFWHTQVISGLTLKAKPGAIKHGKRQKVTFTVTDAGDRVGGAKVKVGARKCTTKASGKCTIGFARSTKAGKLSVRASHPGYAGALIKLRVK
jgi:hypothetical protein